MNKRCCFAGHSKLCYNEVVYNNLAGLVEYLITKENVSEFMVGNYGKFDALSANAARSLKEKYPDIRLTLVIPYLTENINRYKETFYKNYDSILMADIPEKTPKKFQILKCNEYMVNKSDFLICYVKHSFGGAAATLEYAAKKKHIRILNLAVNEQEK